MTVYSSARHLAVTALAVAALVAGQASAWAGACGALCSELEATSCCDKAPAAPLDDSPDLGADLGCCELLNAAGCASGDPVADLAPAPVTPAAAPPPAVATAPVVFDQAAHATPGVGPPPARAAPTRTIVLLL
jgi:hypothetical protein